MCTLLALVPPPGGVLQIAANRDEFLARPASAPLRWPGPPALLAPRDEEAGGTWLGVNAFGLFVGVTNRHGAARDSRLASRGQLVLKALEAPSVDALHHQLAQLPPRTYNPFHLFYADGRGEAGLSWSDGGRLLQTRLGPGLHVLTERSLGAGEDGAREARARAALLPGGSAPPLSAWADVLRLHAEGDRRREGLCLHAPEFGYGTRSSFLLQLGGAKANGQCAWTEGPPCTSAWADGTALLQTVLGC